MSGGLIGALRHRVTIERPVCSADAGGGATITWTTLGSAFARIEPVTGREIGIADGVAGRIGFKVLLRYRADVLPEMRLAWGTRLLEIRAALDVDGRRRWLECLCEEHLP